ncbi:MAG: hypothetical protein HKN16_10600 [Saprospiraceae bacterium]|nr:hypothetical protein [Saprospiraceae bacterium]
MKRFFFLVAFCSLAALGHAQETQGKMFIKKIGLSTGFDQDRINNMDPDFFLGTARGIEGSEFDASDFAPGTLYGGVCENPYLRAYVTLGFPNKPNTFLDLALVSVFNRYDALYYSRNDAEFFEYQSLNSWGDELMLEGTLNRQVNVANWLKLYGGVGANTGITYDGEMHISGHESLSSVDENIDRTSNDIFNGRINSDYMYETYDTRSAFSQRLFAELGLGIVWFKRVETGFFLKRGIGYRNYIGYGTRRINLLSSGLRVNWIFKQK